MKFSLKKNKNILNSVFKYYSIYKFYIIWLYIFTLVSALLALLPTYYFGKAIDFITNKDFNSIIRVIVIFCIIFIINILISFVETYLSSYLNNIVSLKIKTKIFNIILKSKVKNLDSIKSGELFSIIEGDISTVVGFIINDVLNLIVAMATAIITLMFIIKISIQLSLISVCSIPCYYIVAACFGKYISRRTSESRFLSDKYNTNLQEALLQLKEIKILNIAKTISSRYKDILQSAMKINLKITKLTSFSSIGGKIVGNLFDWILLLYSTWLIIHNSFTLGSYVAFRTYSAQFTSSISDAVSFKLNFQKIKISMDRINKVTNLERELTYDDLNENRDVIKEGNIKIHNIKFKYENSKNNIINGLSIELESPDLYAIVGRSGCGKSTLLNLLTNIYEVQSGEILIDNKNIKDISINELRKKIAYIQQKPHIFNGSIKENLLFVNKDANMDEIIRACKLANIHDFIETLPDKYDTILGESALKVSGGQVQRIAIARAILQNSRILLLDEITSGLDGQSEYYIMESLRKISKERMVVIIAHRLSTVMNVDKIYVMNSGKITESGTHNELIKSSETYRKLFKHKIKRNSNR